MCLLHLVSIEYEKPLFLHESKRLKGVYKICTGLLNQEHKDEISYFIAVRLFIMKTTKTGTPNLIEINERISKMLEEAVLGD